MSIRQLAHQRQPGIWLPYLSYSEEKDLHYALSKKLYFKAGGPKGGGGARAFWGSTWPSSQEQELSTIPGGRPSDTMKNDPPLTNLRP